ncbi:MAG TPA: hypothetical protein VIK61_15930, partial [Acidimicrobiia bacterium]
MTYRRFVLGFSLAAWLLAALHVGTPITFVVVLVFLASCPGAGLVAPLDLDDPTLSGVLLVASSLALDALVAEALLYVHQFTGARVIAVLGLIAIAGAFLRRPAPRPVAANVAAPATTPASASAAPRVELDRSVPVLLVRIGRYPVYHGGVAAVRTFGRAGVPVHAIVEDRFTPAALSRYLDTAQVWPTNGDES